MDGLLRDVTTIPDARGRTGYSLDARTKTWSGARCFAVGEGAGR